MRIAWGGGAERTWQGSIRLSDGHFSELQPLGIEADEPGSIWIAEDGIEVRQRSLRAYDGVDVLLTADLEAQLLVSLTDEPGEEAKAIEIPLRNLIHQPYNGTLDAAGNRILISRSPGDRLQMTFEREHLVFSPGEMFKFALQPHLIEASTSALRYKLELTNSASGQKVWSQEYEAGAEGTDTSITLKLPNDEGVYDLTIAAMQPRSRPRLQIKKTLIERKVQLVVLDTKPAGEAAGPLTRVVEINPANARWWERFGNVPLIPGFRKGPLGNGDIAQWEHPKLGPLSQLGPGGAGPEMSWEAYPLPINHPGQPHVLEIEYPSDVPQAMGLSLLEPNAAGAVMPIGLDSGVYVSDEEAENPNPPQLAKHRVVFWPRTKTPLLLVTNRRQGSRAVYGKITVLSTAAPFSVRALGRAETADLLPPAFPDGKRPERLLAGYLDRPLFAENFSAPEALDVSSHRSLDDWTTFYQGGLRLTKYLKHVGYGGLMMSVYADGSTIYPSQQLQPTPRYDTGIFFATGQDPIRKDSLELLFRLFDRDDLTMIPALHFASPLPELEALKRQSGGQATGLEWIGADGMPLLASRAPRQGLGPYYNLLDPRVQEAMLKVAHEVSARYGRHASFGGLSLQLSADGYAQLPGDDCGFDDQTIARFEHDTNTHVPGSGPQRFAVRGKHLTGPARAEWLQWRANVVADFHRRLAAAIAAEHPKAKLYLAGGTMLDHRQTQHRLRPALLRRTKIEDAMLELGIRVQAYRDEEQIVLLRPQHLRPATGPLAAQAADLEMNLAPDMDRLFASGPQPGSLFYHEPQKTRLASFDAKSPFGAANTYTWLVSQMSPSGDRNRRRFAHSVATLDADAMFDGGWLLPLGQEDALKDLMSVYRLLPRERFETVAGEFQPVTIRTLVRGNQTFAYLVNDSAWEVSISMRLDAPSDCKIEKLGESHGVGPVVRSGAESTWKVTLRPYDLVAARFSAANVRVRNPAVSISEQVRRGLQRRIQDLGACVAALGNPQPLAIFENPGFELPLEDNQIPGWTVEAGMDGEAALDPQQKHGGEESIKLSGSGQSVTIRSAPFEPSATGRLAVEVWVRAAEQSPQPSLRIAVEWQLRDGKSDERFGVISAVGTGANARGNWVRYSFPIDDLPSDGASSARVRFDLLSAGDVWIDDVQVFDLSFSEAERFELSKMISLANLNLEKGQIADCARLLEGYWPRFLVANVPLTQTSSPVAQRPRSLATPPVTAPKKQGMLDNIKGYLPKLQR